MNPDYATLRSYIDAQRQSGVADQTIYQSLVTSGWPEAVLQQLFSPGQSPLDNNSVQSPATAAQPLGTTSPPVDTNGFFRGRLGRLGFLMSSVYMVIYFIFEILLIYFGHGSRITSILVLLMGLFGVVAVIPISISVHIRRWHDIDQSGWLTLLNLTPIGFLAQIVLLVAPGTAGPNKYGSAHSKSLSPKAILGLSK